MVIPRLIGTTCQSLPPALVLFVYNIYIYLGNFMFPYPNLDTFLHSIKYFELADFGRMALVCRHFNSFLENGRIWTAISNRESIPYVYDNQERARHTFRVIYPMTSVRIMRSCYHMQIGAVPTISNKLFEQLARLDPDGEGIISQTHVFVVVPPNLSRVSLAEMNRAIFRRNRFAIQHDQACTLAPSDDVTTANEVGLYLIRKTIALQFMQNKDYCITEDGSSIAPSRVRALYLSTQLCKTGQCPECHATFKFMGYGWGCPL